jgi:hypothetical protein
MRLEELANTFLDAQTKRLSANTRRAYGFDFGLLARTVPDPEAQDISVEVQALGFAVIVNWMIY